MKITVKVKPRSKNPGIEAGKDGALVVRVKSAPIDGRANEEVIEALSEHFSVRKNQIRIKVGLTSSSKIVEIEK